MCRTYRCMGTRRYSSYTNGTLCEWKVKYYAYFRTKGGIKLLTKIKNSLAEYIKFHNRNIPESDVWSILYELAQVKINNKYYMCICIFALLKNKKYQKVIFIICNIRE